VSIKIVFLDCDGTLTTIKSSWEYLHRRLGLWDNNADLYQKLFRNGIIDYYEFCKRDALLWRGLSLEQIIKIIEEIPLQKGVEAMIRAFKEMNIFTVIVSTGLSFLVDRIKEGLGIDMALSNELLAKNGSLTGDIKINVEFNKKGEIVESLLATHGFKKEEACAIGDGEGDTGMFRAVGLSIGFYPHPNVLPIIHHTINKGSLEATVNIIKGRP
jgi:phosphoserine phosphatase